MLRLVVLILLILALLPRGTAGGVLINELMPNPASGGEWVELYNAGAAEVDLSGWRVDDDTLGGSRTTIADGVRIAPGAHLLVPLAASILNNSGGDAAQLLDPADYLVDSAAYTGTVVGPELCPRA
jgi:Lamin Tail Domain